MKLSFRHPKPGPTPDQIIDDLSAANARLRDRVAQLRDDRGTLAATVAYQNGRMREMAAQILGSQTEIVRYQRLAAMWGEIHSVLVLPDAASTVDHVECLHPEAQHGQWGCSVCDCTRPRSAFRVKQAVAS